MNPFSNDESDCPGIRGPYPSRAVRDAEAFIVSCYGARQKSAGLNTAKCAAGFNTPLWQRSVWKHLTDQERLICVEQSKRYRAQFQTPELA